MIKNLYEDMKGKQTQAQVEYKKKVKEAVEGKYFQSGSVFIHVKKVIDDKNGWPPNGILFSIIKMDTRELSVIIGNTSFGHNMDETYEEITKDQFESGADKFAQSIKDSC